MSMDNGSGNPDNDKTISVGNDRSSNSSDGASSRRTIVSSKSSTDAGGDALDARTRLVGDPGARPTVTDTGDRARPQTRIGGRGGQGGSRADAQEKTQLYHDGMSAAGSEATSDDPVVGWLVVEKGPGRGQSLQLGIGMNAVGRGANQRVRLSFGDPAISSEKHFFISYDPRSNQFAVHRGESANLTYLNGAPVYGTEPLNSFAQIEAGGTTLRFVAFCGDSFSWANGPSAQEGTPD